MSLHPRFGISLASLCLSLLTFLYFFSLHFLPSLSLLTISPHYLSSLSLFPFLFTFSLHLFSLLLSHPP
ncbi:hypothetical protein QBC45DRAFT_399661 [Copromyces sp. CBS 386.78]|nr:hypothetical protein QBC45DRAFT_399661 [Copromyces sp. CBS 386.78]